MQRYTLACLALALVTAACSAPDTTPPEAPQAAFEQFLDRYRKGPFIKSATLEDDRVARLTFYPSYEAYKGDNPDSQLSKTSYHLELGSEQKAHSTLMRLPMALFRALPTLERVQIGLASEDTRYAADVRRTELEAFFDTDFSTVEGFDFTAPWPAPIANRFDDVGRTAYVDRFVSSVPGA